MILKAVKVRNGVGRGTVRLSKCVVCNVWVIIGKVLQVCYLTRMDVVWRWWCIIRIIAPLVSRVKLVALSSSHCHN